MRRGLTAVAILFLFAHLISLPPALDDIDAINFALGVRDFDVAQHQPHPPGYPLFIALGKIATPVLRALGTPAPEVRGLALWSALGGALLVWLVAMLWRAADEDPWRPALAAVLTAASPLFWFTSLRPLSDVCGLCVAIAAVTMTLRALPPPWSTGAASAGSLTAGAFLAGLAIGFRSQTVVLTAPLLAIAVLTPWSRLALRQRLTAVGGALAGVLVWAVPLVIASGGLSAYLRALGSQAGEDFTGVVMLWTNRSVRVAAFALLNTFVLPWDSPLLAGVVLVLAAAGLLLLAWRAPRRAALLLIVFGPYALFHLVFQETATTRYALPLMLPLAYLMTVVLTEARPIAGVVAGAGLASWMLWLAVPAGVAYARTPGPTFGLLHDMAASPSPLVGMHRRAWTESRRARLWSGLPPGQVLPAPRDYEWLELTHAWRASEPPVTSFIADPRRTDLALVDPASRRSAAYRWPFNASAYVGGARPDELDLVTITRPGWFLEEGWSLTPEAAGVTQRDGWGPHRKPSVGWIRRRAGETVMMIGGRHLGATTDPHARVHVSIDDREVLSLELAPGFFLHFVPLPAGALEGAGAFARLSVTADRAGGGSVPPVAIEQFDVQDTGVVEVGFADGWYEPEYNPLTGRAWRWMSERATLQTTATTRDLQLSIAGESTLRYYPRPSRLMVNAGGETIATFELARDFSYDVTIPAALLAKSNGHVTLEADQMFIPGDREGTGDRRHLSVRLYSVTPSRR